MAKRYEKAISPENAETVNSQAFTDPFEEIFGSSNKISLLGSENDTIPDGVVDFLEENGLSKKSFYVILREFPEGVPEGASGQSRYPFVKSFRSIIPSYEWIGKNYGPGRYLMQFQWYIYDDDGKQRRTTRDVEIIISDKMLDDFKANVWNKKITEMQERKERLRNAKHEQELEQILEGAGSNKQQVDPMEAGKQYVAQIVEAQKMLGLSHSRGPSIDWEKILPVVATALPAVLKVIAEMKSSSSDQFNQMMMLMLSQNKESTSQLLQVMQNSNSGNSNNRLYEDFRDMVRNVVDIKKLADGDKESIADKIFSMVEGVAPTILQMAAMSKQQRESDLRVRMARGYMNQDPNFQAMQENPEIASSVVRKLDDRLGADQTDKILEVVEIPRPADCPRPQDYNPAPSVSDEQSPGQDEREYYGE